jgi:nucleoside-diphosphate-sugar epimerase
MKILITGATGFIGKNLVQSMPMKADVLDRQQDLVHLVHIGDYDAIIHLAANPLVKTDDIDSLYSSNVKMTLDILQNRKKDSHLIFASSATVYGDGFNSTEKSPTIPSSPYGFSKLASEALIQMYGGNYTILRFCANVGRYSTHGVLHDLTQKYKNNSVLDVIGSPPGSMKPFIHVSDTVNCIGHVLVNSLYGVYNIGNDEPITVQQIVDEIESFYGQGKLVNWLGESANWKGDNKFVSVNNTKIKETGFKYTYPTSIEALRAAIRE